MKATETIELAHNISNYELEVNEMKNILLKEQLTDLDLVRLKNFLYQGVNESQAKRAKDKLRERFIMIAYLLDI